MVRQPSSYPWSGHRRYLGIDTLPCGCIDWVLSQFGKRLNTCRKRFEEFILAVRGEGYQEESHDGGEDQRVLGEERFVKKVLDTKVYQPYLTLDYILI